MIGKGLASGGRWNCKICAFNICDACRPQYEGSLKDEDGHFYSWSTKSLNYVGAVYHCLNCKRRENCNKGRWTCNICNYDLCPSCRPPIGPIQTFPSPLEDPAKHSLYWSLDSIGYKDGNYKCAVCSSESQCSKGRWNCAECKYNVCSLCKQGKALFISCKNNHKLTWSNSDKGYTDKNYNCSICDQVKVCENGRWNCAQCKYEICSECRPLISPEAIRIYTECNKGHMLEWSRNFEGYQDKSSICATCGIKQACPQGRWCCLEDKYNVCPACRFIQDEEGMIEEEKRENKNKPNTMLLQCFKSHPLKVSIGSTGYADKMYICKICGKRTSCGKERWNCQECKYDVCMQCSLLTHHIQYLRS